jgi:hypothetical protein
MQIGDDERAHRRAPRPRSGCPRAGTSGRALPRPAVPCR